MTREIGCAADAAGQDFLVLDDLVSATTCERLADLHARHGDRFEQPDEAFWRGRLLGYRDILGLDPNGALRVRLALAAATSLVRDFYRVAAPLYADVVHIVGWPQGWSMPTHADNANADGSPHALAHRAFSGVLYLTDDFDGGALRLPRQNVVIRPKRGMFVSLPAGLSHEHAVTRVERGVRTTMAFFLTLDPTRADRLLSAPDDATLVA